MGNNDLNIDILKKREALGITIKEFADALGYTTRQMFNWETGVWDVPETDFKRIMDYATVRPYESNDENPRFRFIDLFADVGGMRIPFQELGGKCVFVSESDEYAARTYFTNFGDEVSPDISKVSSESIPDFDVLLGSFSCKELKEKPIDGKPCQFDEIIRILKDKQPKIFLLETGREFFFKSYNEILHNILSSVMALNYNVNYTVVSAKDFGVPQHRTRTYFVGFNQNYFNLPEKFVFQFPDPDKSVTKLGDILEQHVAPKYTVRDKLWEGLNKRKTNKVGYVYALYNAESPYTTAITQRYYRDGAEALIEQEGGKPRRLTPRECARLQGFPDDFLFPASNKQAYIQAGRSVTIPVIRAIAKKIFETIDTLAENPAK